jgi:hypothetical protein
VDLRTKFPLTNSEAHALVAELVNEVAAELIDSDSSVNSRIAETNASGFVPDDSEPNVTSAPNDPNRFDWTAEVTYSGDQDPERMFAGTTIVAQLEGSLDYDGESWSLNLQSERADIEYPSESE